MLFSDAVGEVQNQVGLTGEIDCDDNNLANISFDNGARQIFLMAKAFLSISSMTHKKLQMLCYYSKAWYLALYDENIVQEQFEAGVHGAVQPELYHEYKKYGFDIIPKNNDRLSIPEEFLFFANEVYDSYGDFTGEELEALNHTETPWINARVGCKPWEKCNMIIAEEDMKEYYRRKIDEEWTNSCSKTYTTN